MVVRFLETLPSSAPDVPFMAGQVVHLPRLTPEFSQWLRDGRVEVVRQTPEDETAAVEPGRGTRRVRRVRSRRAS